MVGIKLLAERHDRGSVMKTVAVEADQSLQQLLDEVERGEEILITRGNRGVALLRPCPPNLRLTPEERRAAIEHAIALLENAPAIGISGRITRAEIYDERDEELARRRRDRS